MYVLHALPISVLVILFFIYLFSPHDAIFIVKFSLTFHYFRSIVTKYVAQLLKQPRSFYLCKWKANMAVYWTNVYIYILLLTFNAIFLIVKGIYNIMVY